MKIEAIIFDLDGVLVETKSLHAKAFCDAAGESGVTISEEEHAADYCGLSTSQKIRKLIQSNQLEPSRAKQLQDRKQELTSTAIHSSIVPDPRIKDILRSLQSEFKLGLATNSISSTTRTILDKLGIAEFFNSVLTNFDVSHPKPDPEIYFSAIRSLDSSPRTTLIVEDSPIGVKAARSSGAHVLVVKDPNEVTLERIQTKIQRINDNL